MTQKLEKRRARAVQGFTIIEVMIVLAIAGLILLIVFLAVPALQRSSRNTQRKTDVSAVLAAVDDFENNNGGTAPPANSFAIGTDGTLTISSTGMASATAKLGYYKSGQVTVQTAYQNVTGNPTGDQVTIYEGTRCASATSSAQGNNRQVAAVYAVETGGGTYAWQCQEG
ncbi:MAG TPA: prepilin-type N-terminal cleavage/methylation domain-containing protein [Candidatus Saccharimonadales bacterium]|nr:prepilin-type N-terminal cleavage/methylation domain-containing protein [Candidatus Saccharimonadales bacterium]